MPALEEMAPTVTGYKVVGDPEVVMSGSEQGRDELESAGLVFQDDQHNSRTLQSLNMMRKNRHFCDVVLHVGSAEFHAHRAVLASASSYLFEMFTADDETKGNQRENVITYKLNGGFDKSALEKLIHYAYTAKLEVPDSQVKAVYLAACHLMMDRVMKECTRHFIRNLNVDNCIETRSLPGIARNKTFVGQVEEYIAQHFGEVSKSKILLSLPCVRIEVLNQTRQEMSLVVGESVCQLVLDWVKRQYDEEVTNIDSVTEKVSSPH
uniref:BTB domain-containing protein n=1 Tax=Timema douglasi TaxID=61478 RepID=A0A7R8VX66_TIMDO|nr:unnamed protein product [Timema douglasi]